ncbi:MAG TPA: pyridoxal-dependent decarboxylase [Saprospiraceae bacterium]|nr:pyridoxal-dependent decarboxylase [Saprospiraceae bacterium]HNT18828.1 pyridoxal-dependent decarboxylase [Saprospiraceae bacterium]
MPVPYPDPALYRKHAAELTEIIFQYLSSCREESLPVLETIPPESAYRFWKEELQNPTLSFPALFSKIIQGSTHLHHPGYIGHQVAVPHPYSMLADMAAGLLNNGMAVYEMGQVSVAMERAVCEQIADRLEWNGDPGGIFTSGGSLANLTALLSARQKHSRGKYWEGGHADSPPLAVMVSSEAHYCISRAVKIMGLGRQGLVLLPVNERFQTEVSRLEDIYQKTLSQGIEVFAFVANACSTATGAYDDIETIAGFCKKHQIWLHVDGAHGGAVLFSDRHRALLQGAGLADSITVDFHKLLQSSILCTALVYRSIKDSYPTFSQGARYLFEDDEQEWYQTGKRTFECTKAMMVLKAYTLLHQLGETSLGQTIDRQYQLASDFAEMLINHGHFQLACKPQSNIVCFRYTPPGIPPQNYDLLNREIREELVRGGKFYPVLTTIRDSLYLRTALMNPGTTLDHLASLIDQILAFNPEKL